jgi:hypothetical protein
VVPRNHRQHISGRSGNRFTAKDVRQSIERPIAKTSRGDISAGKQRALQLETDSGTPSRSAVGRGRRTVARDAACGKERRRMPKRQASTPPRKPGRGGGADREANRSTPQKNPKNERLVSDTAKTWGTATSGAAAVAGAAATWPARPNVHLPLSIASVDPASVKSAERWANPGFKP